MLARMYLTALTTALLCGTTQARAADSDHAPPVQHHHSEGGHAAGAMGARHGGQIQHTGARAYEFVRHERAAMLFLYTHSMEPITVRPPVGRASKKEHGYAPAEEGRQASGTVVLTKEDGTTVKVSMSARKDAMHGVSYLHLDLPPDIGNAVTFTCEVHVNDDRADTVEFVNPPVVPMHAQHDQLGAADPSERGGGRRRLACVTTHKSRFGSSPAGCAEGRVANGASCCGK